MLSLIDIFQSTKISLDFLTEFMEQATILSLSKNEYFVQQDEKCEYIGIVKRGYLYGFADDFDGDKKVSDFYCEGSVVSSYRSFITGCLSVVSIKAQEDSELYVFNREKYETLLQSAIWIRFFQALSNELYFKKCQKDALIIQYNSGKRYQKLIHDFPKIEQIFPQYLIASYLQMRPETLSRIKNTL